MKKLNYFLTLVAGTMLMSACSNDKEVLSAVDEGTGVQQIVLQVASNGDGLTTRAGRPLLSNEAAQDIQKVVLVITTTGASPTVKYSADVTWTEGVSDYSYGKMKTITIPEESKLEQGSYNIYAYGYSNPSDYKTSNIDNLKETFVENLVLGYTESGSKTPEEIFAGSKALTVNTNGFSTTVVLNRQVAGAYFYVYNLPMVDGLDTTCKLQLVASDSNDQLVLGSFNSFDLTGNGSGNGEHINYVVNGTKSSSADAAEHVICEANISDWYSQIKDADENGIVDAGDNWIDTKTANNVTKKRKGAGYVKGSIFASNFVIPFKATANQTLTLKLVKTVDGAETELASWKVNLPEAQIPNTLTTYGEGGFTLNSTPSETKNCYSILRNHLYCVGAKKADGKPYDPEHPEVTPDPDPTDPTDPDNNPQDLSKDQNIVLKVNHNWEVIYQMVLDPQ